MSAPQPIADFNGPLQLPEDLRLLEVEVAQMQRAVALLDQRRVLAADLAAREVAWQGQQKLSREDIIERVAARHHVKVDDILGPSKLGEIVAARQEAMFLMRAQLNRRGEPRWSFPQIGHFLNRDHTTVLHGCDRHADRLAAAAADLHPTMEQP